jgi:UDP-2,3-diacylglucosamine hydrolase
MPTKPVLKLEAVWPKKVSLAVVSDVHLKTLDDQRGRLLLDTIEQIGELPLDTFVLLGDIFDFALGSNAFYRRKFADLGKALTRLSERGKRVIFFEGNHEFEAAAFKWPGVEFIPEGDYRIDAEDGHSIILTHGDMLYDSWVYQSFRVVVKSKIVTGVAKFTPGFLLDKLTLKSSELSRAQDKYRTMDHQAILQWANTWIDKTDCVHGVFGHYHVPYAEPRQGASKGKVVSMDSWDVPNLVLFAQGSFHRVLLEKEARLLKAETYFRDKNPTK